MPTHAQPLPTRREDLVDQLDPNKVYDMAIVGGGATGLGLALDAASRGYSVVLVESDDFAPDAAFGGVHAVGLPVPIAPVIGGQTTKRRDAVRQGREPR